MEKTIETVWKEGFLDESALVAPRINALYDRKSQQMIDKLVGTLRKNWIVILLVASVIFAASVAAGAPLAGAIAAAALGAFAVHARSHVLRLETLDRTADSYHYVRAFNETLAAFLRRNALAFRLAVPVFVVGVGEIFVSGAGSTTLRAPAVAIAIIIAIFGGPISRFDVNLVYGRMIKRLREIQADMEELGAGSSNPVS